MKIKLIDVVYYIIKNYKETKDLKISRLTKTIYLADWHQCINYYKQITNIKWYYDHYGPFVYDVKNEIIQNKQLIKSVKENNKNYYQLTNPEYEYPFNFSEKQKKSLDYTIKKTQEWDYFEFVKLVYSTYPIFMGKQYSFLDLVECAKKYNEEKETWDKED